MRTSNGCWTCRLRRKKCDENHPVCDVCTALRITCYNDQDNRPEWMDGSMKQEAMAEQLKREVKEKARRRRGERGVHISSERSVVAESSPGELIVTLETPLRSAAAPVFALVPATTDLQDTETQVPPECSHGDASFERSNAILFMFYVEKLLPFLFPFYCPSFLEGGKAWILEMMVRRPVVRQAVRYQSFYFSVACGTVDSDAIWGKLLTQTQDAFVVLRRALQFVGGSNIADHLHGAVRILASIVQLQRFETTVLSSGNWQVHLNAAVALFRQLIDSPDTVEQADISSRFKAVMRRLGSSSSIMATPCTQAPTAEQAAFRFSSALVIFDDIIASTVLQEQPRLYEYHRCLLGDNGDTKPHIILESIVGVRNSVLLEISEIATLDAWKQRCKAAGNLNVMELARRATTIEDSLVADLMHLKGEADTATNPKVAHSPLEVLTQPESPAAQSFLASQIWAHAAFVYLSIVVSGWQPASADVCLHVDRIIELLNKLSPPAMLRTMVWPFCVAGCLAEPAKEAQFREMVQTLQPSIFGTVHTALRIMESVWHNRNAGDVDTRDLAMCFRGQGDLVLLV